MIKTNYHTHTVRCHHATGNDENYVISAIKGGFTELGFSDHTPWKYQSSFVSHIRMKPEEIDAYVESIRHLQNKYETQINIKIGLECEYFPKYIPWLKEIIQKYQLDYVIFGNHFYSTDEEYPYFGKATLTPEMLNLYEKSSLQGLESGIFTYFAHPDLFMRSYPIFDNHCERISRNICKKAKELNIPLEYNFAYLKENESSGVTGYPHPRFWEIAKEEGVNAIIGMDAHDNKLLEDDTFYVKSEIYLSELGIKVIKQLP